MLSSSSTQKTVRCLLLGVSCDLPAGRKVCGFLAKFGCSKCLKEFPGSVGSMDYSERTGVLEQTVVTDSMLKKSVSVQLKVTRKGVSLYMDVVTQNCFVYHILMLPVCYSLTLCIIYT